MKKLIGSFLVVCLLAPLCFACSNFQLKAKDGTVVIGRSMEFPIDLKSAVVVVPRGQQFNIVNSKGLKGVSWTAKYGYLGITAFGLKDTFVGGINEQGLAFEGLVFGAAVYQPEVAGKYVPLDKFGSWLMGNFATVAEVKKALAQVNVSASEIDKIKAMKMHISINDATGKNLVVEFSNGQVQVYDNPLGIMTNMPSFSWQLTNLSNYINLGPADKKPRKLNGVKIDPAGVGSGMLGMPGDWTPPSRFVRLALCIDAALPPKNAAEAINLAEHLLNVVDMPKGGIKENPAPFVTLYGYAQWVVIKDLTNKTLYFKTYDNTAWRAVDLKKFDLQPGTAVKSMPIDSQPLPVIDVSGSLK